MSRKRPQQKKAKVPGLMGLPEASQFCGQFLGIPVAPSTMWRWVVEGYLGVILKSTRLGNRRFVTAEAIRQFMAELSSLPPRKRRRTTAEIPSDSVLEEFAGVG
jgi:hypothetical protein